MLFYQCDKCGFLIVGKHPYIGGTQDGQNNNTRLDFCEDCWPPLFKLISDYLKPPSTGLSLDFNLDDK